MLVRGSRYEDARIRQHTLPDGRVVRYIGLRLPGAPRAAGGHVVDEGERIDHIAAARLGDPERFWALCDVNRALRPEDLLRAGRRLDLPADGGAQ